MQIRSVMMSYCLPYSFATGAVLIKIVIPDFALKQELSTPPNLMMGLKKIWELFLFQVGPFVPP